MEISSPALTTASIRRCCSSGRYLLRLNAYTDAAQHRAPSIKDGRPDTHVSRKRLAGRHGITVLAHLQKNFAEADPVGAEPGRRDLAAVVGVESLELVGRQIGQDNLGERPAE